MLARDDVRVVERVHEDAALLLHALHAGRVGLVVRYIYRERERER